ALIASVASELATIARVTEVPFERMAAHAMTDAYLAGLRDLVAEILARGDADGVVLTHGTNTLEETAWLLHLTVATDAPIVLTGAMRPASALSGDGPLNLVEAVRVAASPAAVGLGVLVVMDDSIHGARDVTKTNTLRVDAFSSPMTGPLGRVDGDGRVVITSRPARATSLRGAYESTGLRALPRVDVVASYQGADGVLIDAAVRAGARGIVSAGTGDGYPTPSEVEALERAAEADVVIVQASRTGSGRVAPVPALIGRGWASADDLVPWKARTLLRLALAAGEDVETIRARFVAG
ncbi:MAG TPA: asparaginase, partial [Candidatus Limnocylindrales bacterium]